MGLSPSKLCLTEEMRSFETNILSHFLVLFLEVPANKV